MSRANKRRLASIDVLRGVAALSVVTFHSLAKAHVATPPTNSVEFLERCVLFLSQFGGAGVILFFVISGFCIHLRYADNVGNVEMPPYPPFVQFWKRRFIRLYPPYAVCLALFALVQLPASQSATEHISLYGVVMHVFMLQNLDPRTVYSIMPVAWTLAVEEQLYLAYVPMLFLRRRLGWLTTIFVALLMRVLFFAAALLMHRLARINIPVEFGLTQWFAWVLGAFAVEAHVCRFSLPKWTQRIPVFLFCACVAGAGQYALNHRQLGPWQQKTLWLSTDVMWAIAFFVLVNCLVHREGRSAWHVGRLGRALRNVGLMSYSLYLTHDLVVRSGFSTGVMANFFFSLLVALPSCIVIAFLYYRLVESPCEKSSRKIGDSLRRGKAAVERAASARRV